ncbi:MAG: NAD(+)/NADH kinase [Nitrososphaerales archaeon]
MKISRIGIISKEGHGEAKQIARDVAELLLANGISVTSFPNLHMNKVDHVRTVAEIGKAKIDLVITVSGDGTILRLLRSLDSSLPCLCINVGGRGILAEIKPDQIKFALRKIEEGDFHTEKRLRISPAIENRILPPALNDVFVMRQSLSKTPLFTLDLDHGTVFSQRMDGLMLSTPTGSTGHSYSYGSPFLEGSLQVFEITPVAPINRFPVIISSPGRIRVLANYSLKLVIDGQDTFTVEADTYVSFKKHDRDAVFVRFDRAGPYRQLRNLGFK